MDKVSERGASVLYKVSTDDYDSADFYIEVDKARGSIRFYTSEDFSAPIYVIDDTNQDEPIESIPGVHKRALMGAISKAFKIMKMDAFPEKLSHSA
jgi:hypothetical protein